MDDELQKKGSGANKSEEIAREEHEKAKQNYDLYKKFSNPGLDKLTKSIMEIQKHFSLLDKIALPVLKQASVITSTFELMARTNAVRAEKYPAMAENLTAAASYSWFTSLLIDFPTYERLAFITDDVDPAEREKVIEEAYAEAYRELYSYLSDKITSMFPLRSFALIPAFAAHLREEYALSVPVFFSQAEGILRDITSSELFSARTSPAKVFAEQQRAQISVDDHWVNFSDDAIWAQLSGDLPIGWGPGQRRANNYTGLNRNTTLHGIDMSYATEINSLKAFSLLCYTAGLTEWLSTN
ncbi:hypothetical protein [Pseudomonas fluorescens]|uniref:hypothetical protein n=1 Tax=Pseudomonas fluorescens TaxID=294 RepID=UPI00277EC9BE|nr:hypothetical protein [Pseudomonas fluorescens]MDP9783459.1 hypothetical protein [Pseudomonas fluorescens]